MRLVGLLCIVVETQPAQAVGDTVLQVNVFISERSNAHIGHFKDMYLDTLPNNMVFEQDKAEIRYASLLPRMCSS